MLYFKSKYLSCESCLITFDLFPFDQARGLFSSTNTTSSALPSHTYVCSADVVAQVRDVLHSHLYTSSSVSEVFGSGGSMLQSNLDLLLPVDGAANCTHTPELSPEMHHAYLSTAMLAPREKHWTVVSGSADLLTVLACSTVDAHTSTAFIHVRVFNSAGFKIPTFAVHLTINGNLLCVANDKHLSASPAISAASGSNFSPVTVSTILQQYTDSSSGGGGGVATPSQSVVFDRSSVNTANGVEFFLPDAYIERTFSCRVVQCAPFQVTVRVVYADLVYDEDDIYEIPDTTTSTSAAATTNRMSRANSVSKSVLSGTAANNKASAVSKAKKNATAAANASTRGVRYMDEYNSVGE